MKRNGQSTIAMATGEFASARETWRDRVFSGVNNLYRMARRGRHSVKVNGSTQGESADQDYASEADYFRMVAIGRQFDREDLVAGATVNRLVANVMQTGFGYDPKTGDKEANKIIKARWSAYESSAQDVDVTGERDLHTLARLLFRDSVVSGDIFATKLNDGRQQVFEGHRCRTPHNLGGDAKKLCIHGVQLDGLRRRTAYYFAKDDIALNSSVSMNAVETVPAYDELGHANVLHVYHPKRSTQTRGVTKFAPISDAVPMHADIQFAKMVQQQQVSVWAMLRQRMLGFEYPDGVTENTTTEPDPCRAGQTRAIMNVSPGMMYTGYPGETITGFSPNVPNPTFFDHARQMQQLIGINLDIPLVMMLLDASETNFSGFRGALEQAKLSFVALQQWFAIVYYRPVAMWQMRLWSDPNSPLADPFIVRLRERGINVFAHEWQYPTWPYIQPVEDATADQIKLRTGMTSLRRAHLARGMDYDTVMDEIVADRKAMIVAAKTAAAEINAQFPDDPEPAHWRDLAVLPPSQGETLALPPVEPERMNQPKPAGGTTDAK